MNASEYAKEFYNLIDFLQDSGFLILPDGIDPYDLLILYKYGEQKNSN
jgi:hypothetical protein